jgi:hypothetical protein
LEAKPVVDLIDPLTVDVTDSLDATGRIWDLKDSLRASSRDYRPASEVAGLRLRRPTEEVRDGTIQKVRHEAPRRAETYRASRKNREKEDEFGREPELMDDFRNFLCIIWEFLGLPAPSGVQLSLAYWLQHGPQRAVILGFRGMAKSWITGAYILWTLYRDPQKKILVISASLDRSVQMVQWCLALIREMPELQFLIPGMNQRASSRQFDVGPSRPDQSPSLKGAGITGQITGSRAHLIVPDDVEIPANSMTTLMREKISENVKEFDAVLHPGGEVKFLGTPQVDDSLYVKLQRRGYTCRIWPARFPDKAMRVKYGDRLSPFIYHQLDNDPTLVGQSVWPSRFSNDDLSARELSYGRSGFALQFMLDTSLSDADRYPLKLHDLIVVSADTRMGPDYLVWSNDNKNLLNALPVMGFEGDHYFGPANVPETFSKYTTILAAIDPSGRGSNETGLSIVGELHGRITLLSNKGWRDGYSPKTLKAIAELMVQFNVHKLVIEDNFGDGMFLALLTPYIIRAWQDYNKRRGKETQGGTEIIGNRSPRVQKELRMLSVLEPASQQHRIVVAASVIEDDFNSIQAYADTVGSDNMHQYSLMHQWSHLTREKDCLLQDDRLESFAQALGQFAELLGINPWETAKQRDDERMEAELEALFSDDEELLGTQGAVKRWHRGMSAVRPT